jgi:ectoine hydroxylase-related dioxygenase (phytanoyl-CoA dioxygenase family)
VVFAHAALPAREMALIERAYQWSLDHPGPGASDVLAAKPGAFYQDHANPHAFAAYRDVLSKTGLSRMVAEVMGSRQLWLLYEQIWLKQANAQRTPWHQDLPYVPMAGPHLATLWINLDPVDEHYSLEFVRGSHRGPLYNPSAFDAQDPDATMFAEGVWPTLPDIESGREAWPIISSAIEPGDVVMFHPAILHGGAPTGAQGRRRSLSLRFFGDQAYCCQRPEAGLHDIDRLTHDDGRCDPMLAMAHKADGTLFRHPGFAQLLPAITTEALRHE